MKRVHLTGGKGFLGRYAAAALAPGWEVEVSDVDTLDVTDGRALERAFAASRPDVVCHLAGLTGANASMAATPPPLSTEPVIQVSK